MTQARILLKTEDARFDAMQLAMHAFGLNQTRLRLAYDQPVDPAAYFALVRRRAVGEPLQYLLCRWEFFGLDFAVGPGVLIPRPETELLVEIALKHLRQYDSPTVLDLCAGTGCIGLSVAHHCPGAQIYLLELSSEAMPYLKQNAAKYPNATVIQANILQNSEFRIPNSELILSNPPYIPAGELSGLSKEVQAEPAMALDGGEDGLLFYRALAALWLPMLAPGGMLAMECGEGQAEDVAALFPGCACEILRDFHEIQRVVAVRC